MKIYVIQYSESNYESGSIICAFYNEQDAINYINNQDDYNIFCLEYIETEIK